ncbi:MAG: hypothetical protein GY904_14430 [Planctomycetaceae bacterium]|nr:hypothetical protein [Planctomycetaceae bacterium]
MKRIFAFLDIPSCRSVGLVAVLLALGWEDLGWEDLGWEDLGWEDLAWGGRG